MATPTHLYHILWAANEFADARDSAADINAYLIANNLWTANVREDSGQPDAWRDYQQILSELGLIYSVQVFPRITLTPLGLAHLDGTIGFSQMMTLQALRMQYPNGHHVTISPPLRKQLDRTVFAAADSLGELQTMAGVQCRPAVLAWRVLRHLGVLNDDEELSLDELEAYVMRCSSHNDAHACAAAISVARNGGLTLSKLGDIAERNARDWTTFLGLTSIFSVIEGRRSVVRLRLSQFAMAHAAAIDDVCTALEDARSFWRFRTGSRIDRQLWYANYGNLDLAIPELPSEDLLSISQEFVGGKEADDRLEGSPIRQELQLREFVGIHLPPEAPADRNIRSVYSARLTTSAHRLHDAMVLLIAETCAAKGAGVFEDPSSVDLLVVHDGREFIVEVKSITSQNLIIRLRSAIGQLFQYDYLRSSETDLPRQKVLAISAKLPQESWVVAFLNGFLNIDLLTLDGERLVVHSRSTFSNQLFG